MKKGPRLPELDWSARDELERKRTRSGTTSIRVSNVTRQQLQRLAEHYKRGYHRPGMDELLYRIATAIVGEPPPAAAAEPSTSMHARGSR
jgi:hypothetical protein